jgi:hypothetical protein
MTTTRHRNDRNLGRGSRVIGGVHADGIDRRDQDALDAARHQILHAVDLPQLVFVRRHRRHLPAELLGACPDAAQHVDVEGVVVLRQRDADDRFLLRGGWGNERERSRKQQCRGDRGQ